MATYKDMQRRFEKAYQALERINYISEIQNGRDSEEHGIRVLMNNSITWIQKAVEHWVSMVQEPQRKMQETWAECEKS